MSENIEAYLDELRVLWPDRGEVRRAGSATGGGPIARRFTALPSAERPRLLVPTDNRRAAGAALRRYSSALTTREVLTRTGAGLAVRTGWRPGDAADLEVPAGEPGADSLADHLAGVLGEPVDVALSIGPARANRKAVVEVFDRTGRGIAFAKVARTAPTRAAVRHEAASLAALAADGPAQALADHVSVPRLVSCHRWRDADVLVMTPLTTSPWQRPAAQWRVPHPAMRALSRAFGGPRTELAQLAWWRELRAVPAELTDAEHATRLDAVLDEVLERSAGRELPVGAWHGDWTPWNQARRQGRWQVWDWERFETGAPEGLDACHYGVNTQCRRDGVSTGSVHAGLRLAGLDPASAADRLTGSLYLAAICARYLRSVQEERGELVSDRARGMLGALEDWTRGHEHRGTR